MSNPIEIPKAAMPHQRTVTSRRRFLAGVGAGSGLLALSAAELLTIGAAAASTSEMVEIIANSEHIGDRLASGESLRAGQYLMSPNERFVALNRASDSLLVVYDVDADIGVWSTGVYGAPGGRVVMRSDGQLVEYRAGEEIWMSGTVSPEAVVLMQNNGWLTMYGKESGTAGPIWANGRTLNETVALSPSSGTEQGSENSGSQPTRPVAQETTVVVHEIRVHESIQGDTHQLVQAAHADGIPIAGWGWRDSADQIRLRSENCGTSDYAIYEMPSSTCSPPTARPGASMHERGLAIDFYWRNNDGSQGAINRQTHPAYEWLAWNASNYGFRNLPSEPWHWSTNGR